MYLRHPAWLWLKKHDKDKLPPIDEATQAIFDTGHRFEPYAESLFPEGLTLGFSDYDQYRDLPARSLQAVADGAKVLFQSRFEYDHYICLPDVVKVVKRSGNKYIADLYEIKSSTGVRKDHLYDLAFQKVVLENNGFVVRKIYVMHVNNQYVRRGEIEPAKLVATTEVTDQVAELEAFTLENMPRALATATAKTMPDTSMDNLGLLGVKADWKKVLDFMNPINKSYPNTKPKVNKPLIRQFLNNLQYPLYFLDYETMMGLAPYFDGQRPYQQVPFQYSLHILDSPDTELRQMEYLHSENSNPMKPLAEQLINDIGTDGTVIVWNQSFEMSRNREIGEAYPELADAMQAINNRVIDLMVPFKQKLYHDERFDGSASIKKVLPVVVPSLSYKDLEIQDGSAAQRDWMQAVLDEIRNDDKDQILANLRQYCGLDTLAMVEIWRVLVNIIE